MIFSSMLMIPHCSWSPSENMMYSLCRSFNFQHVLSWAANNRLFINALKTNEVVFRRHRAHAVLPFIRGY